MKKFYFFLLLNVFITQIFSQKNIICTSKIPNDYNRVYQEILDDQSPPYLGESYYLWDNGKVLVVKFLNGSSKLRQTFATQLQEIEKYTNLKFRITETGDSHFRIAFTNNNILFSEIGTMALMHSQEVATAEMDSTNFYINPMLFKAMSLHIIGHMIGLQDEIFAQSFKYEYWEKNYTSFFTEDEKLQKFIDKYSFNHSNQIKYDDLSIMASSLNYSSTKNKSSIKWNNQLSVNDRMLLASLYSKENDTTTAKPKTVVNFKNLQIQFSKANEGYLFYPQFSFCNKTNTVFYFSIFIVDEDGHNVRTEENEYSLAGRLGASRIVKNIVGDVKNVNNANGKDLQFYIPQQLLKLNNDKKLFAVFKVFQFNGYNANETYTCLYQSKMFALPQQ